MVEIAVLKHQLSLTYTPWSIEYPDSASAQRGAHTKCAFHFYQDVRAINQRHNFSGNTIETIFDRFFVLHILENIVGSCNEISRGVREFIHIEIILCCCFE